MYDKTQNSWRQSPVDGEIFWNNPQPPYLILHTPNNHHSFPSRVRTHPPHIYIYILSSNQRVRIPVILTKTWNRCRVKAVGAVFWLKLNTEHSVTRKQGVEAPKCVNTHHFGTDFHLPPPPKHVLPICMHNLDMGSHPQLAIYTPREPKSQILSHFCGTIGAGVGGLYIYIAW